MLIGGVMVSVLSVDRGF